ncbi:MAG: hypothetical protein V4858_09055 [Pseudomonadota bacterium]
MTTQFPPFKAGGTFSYAGTCRLPTGTWTATCELRSTQGDAELLGSIEVTLGATVSGVAPIALYASAVDTATWPVGQHQLDIRYADSGGTVVHTSTLLLPVIRAVTEA